MEIHKRAIKLIKAGDASIELLQLRDSSAEAVKVMHQTLLYINKFVADSELRYLIYTLMLMFILVFKIRWAVKGSGPKSPLRRKRRRPVSFKLTLH